MGQKLAYKQYSKGNYSPQGYKICNYVAYCFVVTAQAVPVKLQIKAKNVSLHW